MDNHPGQPGSAFAGTLPRTSLPVAITGWIRAGMLDADLAGLASIMTERGLPLIIAAAGESRAAGWSGSEVRDGLGQSLLASAVPATARIMTTTPVSVDADSLESVLLRMPELSLESAGEAGAHVAIVLVLGPDSDDGWRVTAAHLLRPPLRDGHGHLQRQGPAVLSTWDATNHRFEHFSWAVMAELAALVEVRAGDLEAEVSARTGLLAGLCDQRIDDPGAVRLALEAARTGAEATPHRL